MLTVYVVLGVLLLLMIGLAASRLLAGRFRRRLVRYVPVGLLARRYVVWLPTPRRPKAPVPVLLAFHGGGGTIEQFEAQAGLHTAGDARGFAVVYPAGYHRSWNAGRCCGDAQASGIDDLKFVRSLLDDLASFLPIDRRRIYATGFANGAMLCYRLACAMSDDIAAIAPVGGAMHVERCGPARAVPMLHVHGLLDAWAPYDGGITAAGLELPPVMRGIALWRWINNAVTIKRETCFDGAADRIVYGSTAAEPTIELWLFRGLGHHWPGGAPPVGGPAAAEYGPGDPTIDRAAVNNEILRFLSRHALPERPVPGRHRISLDGAVTPAR